MAIKLALKFSPARQLLAVHRQQVAREIAGPHEERLGEGAPPNHLDHCAYVHLRSQVDLLKHLQVSSHPLQTLVIYDQLVAHFYHLVLHVHDPLEALVDVHRELFLRFGASAAYVAQLVVILQHDEQLPPMGSAEIRQNAGVAQIARAALVLQETLSQFALLVDDPLGLIHQLFQRAQPLAQSLNFLHVLHLGAVDGRIHLGLQSLHQSLVELLQTARTLIRHLLQATLIVLRRDPSEQTQHFSVALRRGLG